MAGYSAVANITELVPEITAEVQYIYQDAAIGPALALYSDISGQPGIIAEFPRFTEVVGSASPAETAAAASHQLDLTMPTLTVAKRSVLVQMTGLAIKGATGDIVSQVGMAMAKAKAKLDDTQIFGVLTGTTDWATSAGATNAALTITAALNALSALEQNEVDEVINCVVHPKQYKGIRGGITPVANDDGVAVQIASEMARNAFVSRAFGMNWFQTNRISTATVGATAGLYRGLVFVQSGLGYAHAWSPGNQGLELERLASQDVWNLVLNYYDKAGVIHAPGVCDLYSTEA